MTELVEGKPHWEFETVAGGPVISFDGTIEDLYTYVNDEYPEYLNNVFDMEIVRRGEEIEERDEGMSMLDKRTDFSKSARYCYTSNARADGPAITNGIKYLRGVKGRPSLKPGHSSRVSCSWNSGIRWSNNVSDAA